MLSNYLFRNILNKNDHKGIWRWDSFEHSLWHSKQTDMNKKVGKDLMCDRMCECFNN